VGRKERKNLFLIVNVKGNLLTIQQQGDAAKEVIKVLGIASAKSSKSLLWLLLYQL